jgi:hypothetical protein
MIHKQNRNGTHLRFNDNAKRSTNRKRSKDFPTNAPARNNYGSHPPLLQRPYDWSTSFGYVNVSQSENRFQKTLSIDGPDGKRHSWNVNYIKDYTHWVLTSPDNEVLASGSLYHMCHKFAEAIWLPS